MKLEINSILQIYPILKILHYQTHEGFHHEKYDEAFDSLGKILDQYIETYMGLRGRDWVAVAGSTLAGFLLPNSTEACVDRYERSIVKRIVPYLYEVGKGSHALTKLAEDFEQEALKILALLKYFSNK